MQVPQAVDNYLVGDVPREVDVEAVVSQALLGGA